MRCWVAGSSWRCRHGRSGGTDYAQSSRGSVVMSPGRFARASQYYAEFRPELPDVVWRTLVNDLDCGEPRTLLVDLGAGTGEVALAIGARFQQAVLVEPDGEMMNVAKTRLAAVREPAVEFVQCEAEEYEHGARPAPCLVTISRAFHWMDQVRVLRSISAWGHERTAIAILDDTSLWNCADQWAVDVRRLIQSHLGTERRAGSEKFKPPTRGYADVLRGEGFRDVETASWTFVREWDPEAVEGYLYSTSYASPDLFGDCLAEFQSGLHQLLNKQSQTSEALVENATARLVMAHLPVDRARQDHA